jgi:hypothetical protein
MVCPGALKFPSLLELTLFFGPGLLSGRQFVYVQIYRFRKKYIHGIFLTEVIICADTGQEGVKYRVIVLYLPLLP